MVSHRRAAPGFWQDLATTFPERTHCLRVGEALFKLKCLEDLEDSVQRTVVSLALGAEGSTVNEVCPHFGVVWPAAIALAEHLHEYLHAMPPTVKVSTLELGCGLAVPSLIAAHSGKAAAVASDRHPLVPHFLARNAAANSLQVAYQHLDWRRDIAAAAAEPFDMILGSDLLYEAWQPGFLAVAIARLLKRTGVAFIADPGRREVDAFLTLLAANGLLCTEMHVRSVEHAGADTDVLLLRIQWQP